MSYPDPGVKDEYHDAILGLDIGSTSTRAFLYDPVRNIRVDIENDDRRIATRCQYDPGDFSSLGYVLDEQGPVYLGENPDPKREPISLKYAFYILANASDVFLEQYPLVAPLKERANDPGFRNRLLRALVELFKTVRRKVMVQCKNKQLRIKKIALSIPSQWQDGNFVAVYRGIIAEAFQHSSKDICFCTETEALAHVLLREHLDELPKTGEIDVFLFQDFGGHNMNGCIFNVVWGENRDASFYRIGEPFGAGGGTEQWAYNVGEHCVKMVPKASPFQKQRILEHFQRHKDVMGPLPEGDGRLDDTGGWDITLNPKDVNNCFEQAMARVLDETEKNLRAIAGLKGVTPTFIVSGGTAKHRALKQRLRDMCKASGISQPVFVNELSIRYDSGKIARGAALIASLHMSADEFMRRGAGLGLQKLDISNGGKNKSKRLWNDTADLLFSQTKGKGLDFQASGNDEFKIICDPFIGLQEFKNHLYYSRCYDVLDLGKLKAGRWSIRLSMVGSGASKSLVLEMKRRPFKGRKRAVWVESAPMPFFFDGGPNCFHLDTDEVDFESLREGKAPQRVKNATSKDIGVSDAAIAKVIGVSDPQSTSAESAAAPNRDAKDVKNAGFESGDLKGSLTQTTTGAIHASPGSGKNQAPGTPVALVTPMASVSPMASGAPVASATPAASVTPMAPVAPVAPTAPITPTTPPDKPSLRPRAAVRHENPPYVRATVSDGYALTRAASEKVEDSGPQQGTKRSTAERDKEFGTQHAKKRAAADRHIKTPSAPRTFLF